MQATTVVMSEGKSDPPVPSGISPSREIELPMSSFVRGGTMSSAYETDLKKKKADADARRNAEAERQRIVRADPAGARLSTTRLGGTGSHASIVLEIRNSDGHPEEFLVSDLTVDRDDPSGQGLMLIVCCPFCAVKVGSAEAQINIRSRHRRFELDTRRAGELWVNPRDPNEFCTLAGTIHLTEVVTCPGLGCYWRFVIDDSIVRTL